MLGFSFSCFWVSGSLCGPWLWSPTDLGGNRIWASATSGGCPRRCSAFFLLFSLKTREEPNWPITAYLSGLVLAAAWLDRQLHSPRLAYRRATLAALGSACALGIFIIVLMHHSEWFQGTLLRLSGPPTAQHPLPLRRFDPSCRLRGWQTLALNWTGCATIFVLEETIPCWPPLAGTCPAKWPFTAAATGGLFAGLALGCDRHSQYDLWHPNPLSDSEFFRGRTFILVGGVPASLREAEAFEQIEPSHEVTHRQRGQVVAQWTVTICRGFRGFHNFRSSKKCPILV